MQAERVPPHPNPPPQRGRGILPSAPTGDGKEGGDVVGVLLLTFGTADTVADVPAYLAHVRGEPAPADLVAEFQLRLARIGGSPLTRITGEQASCLQSELNQGTDDPHRYLVRCGMLHSPPFIAGALAELGRAGAAQIIAIILSPQYGPVVMGRYLKALKEADAALDLKRPVRVAEAWHEAPSFIEGLGRRLLEAMESVSPAERATVPVLFTAHSLPRSIAEAEPAYLLQLQETAQTVAENESLARTRWRFVYQSAGHTREEWLRPDLVDVFPELLQAGHKTVIVAPIQFVADHLEVLYDVDVAAREQAEAVGLRLVRTGSLNTLDLFIEALAWVARRELAATARADGAGL